MRKSNTITLILGAVTIIAPLLSMAADAIQKDKDMDEIADRVALRLEERGIYNGPVPEEESK